MRRNRYAAESYADGVLRAGVNVTEEQVLAGLRLWYFKKNKVRTNVMPAGASFVESETLGLVRSRDGRIVATRNTVKYNRFFAMLTAWFRHNRPTDVRLFPFTSISCNYNYAAKLHRDGNNVGPSMTKSFGQFTGGELLYWGDDDGTLPLAALPAKAPTYDTSQGLLLFDGLRGHAVSAFDGERCGKEINTAYHNKNVLI